LTITRVTLSVPSLTRSPATSSAMSTDEPSARVTYVSALPKHGASSTLLSSRGGGDGLAGYLGLGGGRIGDGGGGDGGGDGGCDGGKG